MINLLSMRWKPTPCQPLRHLKKICTKKSFQTL